MSQINYGKKVMVTNSILSVASKGISMVFSLITAPLMLNLLGTEKYGVWATVLSLVSWIYTFDLGIGNGLRNKLAECLALDKNNDARKYLGISYFLLGVASLIIFFLIVIFINFVDINAILNIYLQDESLKWIIVAAVLFACINFVASLVRQAFFALQQSGLDSVANTAAQGCFALVLFILNQFHLGYLFLVAIMEGAVQLLRNLISSWYVLSKHSFLRFSWEDIDKRYASGILSFGIQMFIIQIAALILNATDNLIISHYFGAEEVTPYSICYKYFGTVNAVYVAVFTPLMGGYTAAYARRDMTWINKAFRKNLLGYFLFAAGTILAGFLFRPFAYLWLGQELDYAPGMIPLIALYFMMLMSTHVFSCILTAFSMVREVTIAVIIEAIINVPISIYCAVNLGMGPTGVIMGSLAAMVVAIIAFPRKTLLVLRRLNRQYGKMKE